MLNLNPSQIRFPRFVSHLQAPPSGAEVIGQGRSGAFPRHPTQAGPREGPGGHRRAERVPDAGQTRGGGQESGFLEALTPPQGACLCRPLLGPRRTEPSPDSLPRAPTTHASLPTVCLGSWFFRSLCLPPARLPPTSALRSRSGAALTARGCVPRVHATLVPSCPSPAAQAGPIRKSGRGGGLQGQPCHHPPPPPLAFPRHRSLCW